MRKIFTEDLSRYLIFTTVIILFGAILGYHQITPMKAPKNTSDKIITLSEVTSKKADFSMVMSHIYQMAKEPHPSGSEEIKKVQQYLQQQLEAIGCDYQVLKVDLDMTSTIDKKLTEYNEYVKANPYKGKLYEEYFHKMDFSNYEGKLRSDYGCIDTNILPITNYLVHIDAPNTDTGVLFVSHYDSTAGGPGAGDDLIGVASMLEALREASYATAMTNDLYFLFTDGEEADLLGANEFVNSQGDFKDKIKLVINLEARGTSGSLIMFETSLNNKNIIRELNKALPVNTMFSFSAAVYRIMPNITDLTKFLEAGYPGINFAMLGNPENYHWMSDNYASLNRNSTYMYCKTASTLATYFGKADLSQLESDEDAVYFPFLKGNTILLSDQLMHLLSYLVIILSLLWIVLLLFKKLLSLKDLLITFASLLLTLLCSVALGLGGTFLYTNVTDSFAQPTFLQNIIFYAFCAITGLFCLTLLWFLSRRRKDARSLLNGVILLFSMLNLTFTIVFNSIAYLFMIPLALLLVYSVFLYGKEDVVSIPYSIVIIVITFIVCSLYTPVVAIIYIALLSSAIIPVLLLVCLSILPIAALCITQFLKKPVGSPPIKG